MTDMNKLNVNMGAALPMLFKPINKMSSEGSACPLAAWPTILISMMVITIVKRMTVEPLKFLSNSF